MAAEPTHPPIAVPSGAEVWLQEELSDKLPGMGLVQRYRFVMPSLAGSVPPVDETAVADNLPADMFDEPLDPNGPDAPLTASEQAELDAALGDLVIEAVPQGETMPEGGISVTPGLPGDGGEIDAPLPSELAAPDVPAPGDGAQPDSEAPGDLAAAASTPDGAPLPPAPDVLMQDPLHRDIVWLCENYVLPRVGKMSPRPTQVVISMASAPSPFGSFDPQIVQLFEGFSIPPDRDACVWEPI